MTNFISPIDELGALKAQIAELQARADDIARDLKAHGPGRYSGAYYDANVVEQVSDRVDYKRVVESLKLSAQKLRAYTSEVRTLAVRVTARKAA